MSQLISAPAPRRNRGRFSRRLRRLGICLAGASCALILGAGAASADTFSPTVPPQYGYVSDCTITAGPVYDPHSSSHGFAVIGGGRLSCYTAHSYQIWTQEYYSRTRVGGYYLVSTNGPYSATNYGFSGILETGRVCGTGYWITRVTVSLAGYSPVYVDSTAGYVPALGYSATVC